MIKNWLSHYRPRYPRSLVYMLQASEYNVRDYIAWYRRTKDFRHVEKRKHLVRTPKALFLLALEWLFVFLIFSLAAFLYFQQKYTLFLFAIFLAPYFLAYGILIPLILLQAIQCPVEYAIAGKTREKLKKHKAVKIAIAGSFGKTTMREILKTVLSEGKKVAAPLHNYNTPMGIGRFVKTLTGDEEILIFELGEYHPGDIKTLCNMVQPDRGIITGINEAHLEKFKTIPETVKTIYELADFLGEKRVYVNGENQLARGNARFGHTIYTKDGVGEWKIENQTTGLLGTSFTLIKGTLREEFHSGLLGLHHIGPLVVAVDIAFGLGLSLEEIKRGVGKTKPFDHRLEPRDDGSGVITLDDSYNGNPDGVRAVIDFLASLEGCRRWYVTPGLVEMGTRKKEVHRQIGRSLARAKIEKVVLIRNSVTPSIQEGLEEESYTGEILWFDDALSAFAALPHLTARGDVVLLQNDWPDQYE